MSSAMVVCSSGQHPEFVVRLGPQRPGHAVYVRRRLLVGLVVVGLFTVLGLSARSVLADRGGVPASTPAVRPATDPAPPPAPTVTTAEVRYIVQPGDTLWSLARVFHGSQSIGQYVERLVERNGGASLQAGQLVVLP